MHCFSTQLKFLLKVEVFSEFLKISSTFHWDIFRKNISTKFRERKTLFHQERKPLKTCCCTKHLNHGYCSCHFWPKCFTFWHPIFQGYLRKWKDLQGSTFWEKGRTSRTKKNIWKRGANQRARLIAWKWNLPLGTVDWSTLDEFLRPPIPTSVPGWSTLHQRCCLELPYFVSTPCAMVIRKRQCTSKLFLRCSVSFHVLKKEKKPMTVDGSGGPCLYSTSVKYYTPDQVLQLARVQNRKRPELFSQRSTCDRTASEWMFQDLDEFTKVYRICSSKSSETYPDNCSRLTSS